MGEAERFREYKDVRFKKRFAFFRDGNAVVSLIIINAVFFLTLYFIKIGFFYASADELAFKTQIMQWFELPANLTLFSERPWSIVSFMFSDDSSFLLRLISNMFWLWSFGHMMQDISGNNKIIPVYLYGGLAGGIFFIVATNLFPSLAPPGNSTLLGANAAVMAVAVCTTVLDPDYRFYRHIRNGIPIWVLLVFYFFIDLLGVGSFNAHIIAHWGGGIAGFLFVFLLRRGKDGSIWMNRFYHTVNTLFSPSNKKNKTVKETIFYEPGDRAPYNKQPHITQQRIDEILDKINQHGYQFLTKEEKEILRKAANEDL